MSYDVDKHLTSSSMIVTQVVSSPKVPTGETLVRVTENCSSGSLAILLLMIGMVLQKVCMTSSLGSKDCSCPIILISYIVKEMYMVMRTSSISHAQLCNTKKLQNSACGV